MIRRREQALVNSIIQKHLVRAYVENEILESALTTLLYNICASGMRVALGKSSNCGNL